MNARLHKAAILALAALASLLFLHWLAVGPTPLVVPPHELNSWVALLADKRTTEPIPAAYLRLTLTLMALTGLASCALASVLALRLPAPLSARRLAWSLVLASVAAGYLFFATTHAEYRALLGWTPDGGIRFVLDLVAYSAGLLSPLYLARFFMSYPRVLLREDIIAERLRIEQEGRERAASSRWRRLLHPEWMRTRFANTEGEVSLFKLPSAQQNADGEARLFGFLQSRGMVAALLAWAVACAVVDSVYANPAFRASAEDHTSVLSLLKIAVSAPWIMLVAFAWEHMGRCLRIYSRNASPEDRRRVDWIRSTLIAGGMLFICTELVTFTCVPFLIRWLGAHDISLPVHLLILAPITVPLQLATLAFVISLAMSIFYRGAVDPRLMARKVSLYGVVGTLLAVVFVFLERTVALKIVDAFQLAPDTGAMVAFVGVAVTAVPLKKQADKTINALLGRWLPLDSMIAGERRTLVVALSDLSGYTRLSSEDEKQALLLAALLQRQAANLTKAHGGRIVKSMGDAVMFAFEDAASAMRVLGELHREFPKAAANIGLEVLPVHSGAHIGEVTVAHDGDIYGQTVNIAARIQGSASPGQIVVSALLAECAPKLAFEDLGPRAFKNVPEPVPCRALAAAPAA
jgi:class 3 adenylate cyclase